MNDLWTENARRHYQCRHRDIPLNLDGSTADPGWAALPWSETFVDITGDASREPRFKTRVKMAWDNAFFYVFAELEEPHVWGTIREQNAVLFEDNDFEVFIDPDSDGLNYYELEINALGTIWELCLPKPYAGGGVPRLGCNIEGLKKRVRIEGTLNDPSDVDQGWTVELAIPWAGLAEYHNEGRVPPAPGDTWRINFSRVQWHHDIVDGRYVRVPPHGTVVPESLDPDEQDHPEDNWVWSPQGRINMHLPERWGEVTFL